MHVAILNQTDDTSVDSFIDKKVSRAMSRHLNRLSTAAVKIENAGGTNVRCQIEIQTTPRGVLRVEEEDANIHAAVSRAVRAVQSRLNSTSDRQIARSRHRYRASKRAPLAETANVG